MTISTFSSREFNQHASNAKKAAHKGPVFITDRGNATHVLLTIENYKKIIAKPQKIADALSIVGKEIGEMSIPNSKEIARAADFS